MRHLAPALVLLLGLLRSATGSTADLADELATETRALALGPDGRTVALSYHPGSLSILALLGPAGEPAFRAVHGVDGRGRFLVSWRRPDELLAAFVPEGPCADALVLRIAIPAATRAYESQLRPYRGALRPGTSRLSDHASVNRELPVVIDNWGDLDRRSWPGTDRFELPEGACPTHWSEGRLVLRLASGEAANWAPAKEETALAAPLRAPGGTVVATLTPDGRQLVRAGETIPLAGLEAASLLGLGPDDSPWLSARSAATGGLAGVFRVGDEGPELVFADPRYPVESATRLPDSDRLLSIDYGPGKSRRYFLDNAVSAGLRALRERFGERHELLDVAAKTWLTATGSAYWLIAEGQDPVRLEARRAWLDAPIAAPEQLLADGLLREPVVDAMVADSGLSARVLAVPDAERMLTSELRGLLALGVPVLLDAAREAGDGQARCRWSRTYRGAVTETVIACPAGTQRWETVLTRESDSERSARIRSMAAFVGES
ncbi:MAG: hypothetical protein AAGE01_19200 [Pseudomonadota bacterium]